MEALVHLGNGFLQVLQPMNLLVLFIGLVLGMLVAVLPGLTLVMGVVLALPFTYTMELLPAIILLTAMYVSRHLWRRLHRHPVPHSRRADRRTPAVGRLHHGAPGPAGQGTGAGHCSPRWVAAW
jgi:membrane protein implicated in regulation of membrane protease activity